jgi:CheY-like chemotaxis protein
MKSHYIIFADDDADDLELLTGFFKQFNGEINILEFKDGKEVINFLDESSSRATSPDLIVMDINMPRMNGKEALYSIRHHAMFHDIPVVVYTTSNSMNDENYCRSLGASWINKPYSVEGIKMVARILADFCEVH